MGFRERCCVALPALKLMGWRLLVAIAKLVAISIINRLLEIKILWRKPYWLTWLEWSQAIGVSLEGLTWLLTGVRGVISDSLAVLALSFVAVGLGAAATPLAYDMYIESGIEYTVFV